jgi:hypothetical protein
MYATRWQEADLRYACLDESKHSHRAFVAAISDSTANINNIRFYQHVNRLCLFLEQKCLTYPPTRHHFTPPSTADFCLAYLYSNPSLSLSLQSGRG